MLKYYNPNISIQNDENENIRIKGVQKSSSLSMYTLIPWFVWCIYVKECFCVNC